MATTKITANVLADSAVTSAKLANSISIGTLAVTGNLELGNASDTTLSRSAAGKLAVEGVDVVLTAGTQTIAGDKTLSGQIQLGVNQSVTNGNSVLTSDLLIFARARNAAQTYAPYPPFGSGVVGGNSGVSGNNASLTLNSAAAGAARRLTYCTMMRPTAFWSGLSTNFSIAYLAVGTFAIRDLGNDSVTMRFYLGAAGAIALADAPALSAAGICIEISRNSAASGLFQYRLIVHNGTTLSVSSFVNLHSNATLFNRSNSFALRSNGLGNISLWVKSVPDTGHASIPDITTAANITSALGPSGTSGNNIFCVDLATRSNLAAIANVEARVFHYELYTHLTP